ncbi:MAG: hypothetical protein U1F67_16440 [Rubrivivax sp.]
MDTVPQALLDGPGAPALACTAASLAAGSVAARRAFRAAGRRVLAEPQSLKQHLTRVRAACAMAGSEPVQGSLADLWCHGEGTPRAVTIAIVPAMMTGPRQQRPRRTPAASFQAQSRLMPHVARVRARARRDELTRTAPKPPAPWPRAGPRDRPAHAGAARATPARRPDDSRALAAAAEAVRNDAAAGFIEHCRVCGDVAAFLLARRPLLAQARELPPAGSRSTSSSAPPGQPAPKAAEAGADVSNVLLLAGYRANRARQSSTSRRRRCRRLAPFASATRLALSAAGLDAARARGAVHRRPARPGLSRASRPSASATSTRCWA